MSIEGESIFRSDKAGPEWPYSFTVTHDDGDTEQRALILPKGNHPTTFCFMGWPKGGGGHVLIVGEHSLKDLLIKRNTVLRLGTTDQNGDSLIEYRLIGT